MTKIKELLLKFQIWSLQKTKYETESFELELTNNIKVIGGLIIFILLLLIF